MSEAHGSEVERTVSGYALYGHDLTYRVSRASLGGLKRIEMNYLKVYMVCATSDVRRERQHSADSNEKLSGPEMAVT